MCTERRSSPVDQEAGRLAQQRERASEALIDASLGRGATSGARVSLGDEPRPVSHQRWRASEPRGDGWLRPRGANQARVRVGYEPSPSRAATRARKQRTRGLLARMLRRERAVSASRTNLGLSHRPIPLLRSSPHGEPIEGRRSESDVPLPRSSDDESTKVVYRVRGRFVSPDGT